MLASHLLLCNKVHIWHLHPLFSLAQESAAAHAQTFIESCLPVLLTGYNEASILNVHICLQDLVNCCILDTTGGSCHSGWITDRGFNISASHRS